MEKQMFIGVDMGGTNMRSALVDDRGKLVRRQRVATEIAGGASHTAGRLVEQCRRLIETAPDLGGRVKAVGLGVAGKIDRLRGLVIFSPNLPAMRNYPLASDLQQILGIPVIMENDANAFGVGEMRAGSAQEIRNWVGLTLGTGVGGCLVLGGRLWNGDDLGFAGEIGHMIIQPGGPLCACGLQGCLEAHASGRALMEGAAEAISQGRLVNGPLAGLWRAGELDARGVSRCARHGDLFAQSLFERMGWALGLAIANLFTVLGVRHAIIGGGVSASWEQFIEPLKRSLAQHSSMLQAKDAVVLRSRLGDDAAMLGAAWLAREYLENPMGGEA